MVRDPIFFQLIVPILRLFRWPRAVDQVMIIAIRMSIQSLVSFNKNSLLRHAGANLVTWFVSNANLGARIFV
jgi:hypothetical protein